MSVLHLDSKSFKETIANTQKPVLVDFFAEWCMPCKMFAPILEKVSDRIGDAAIIAKINIDEAEEIAAEYRVASIPTLILFKNGVEADRRVGALAAGELMNFLGL